MNVLSRISFWSSLGGLGLALVAPIASVGVSWAEAEVGVVIGLLFTFSFGAVSVATVPAHDARGRLDPAKQARRRTRCGITESGVGALVMVVFGLVAYACAARDGDVPIDPRMPSYEQTYRIDVATDANAGMTSGVLALVGAGLALTALVGFVAKRAAAAPAPMALGHYDPHAHVRALYGPRPAPLPKPSRVAEIVDVCAPTVPMSQVRLAGTRG